VVLIAILAPCLTLFSISLGLVTFGARRGVALTNLSGFGLVTWVAGIAYRSAPEQLRRWLRPGSTMSSTRP
jgi:hypothetical protein